MMACIRLLLFPLAGPPAKWAEHLLSGCIALCRVGGRVHRVDNDLELVIIIVITDAHQISDREHK